jgi:serine/threonine-protein kinase
MMELQRWQRIQELFHQLLDAEPPARADLLEAACGADSALRNQVLALLRAHERHVPILDDGPELLASVLDEDAVPEPPGHVGPYRVIHELGRGGMGIVYLAERDNADFQQRVALKCLIPGAASAELTARFRRERRILAGLAHPNIAQLYDGGFTPAGEPYFAMEYVEGEALDVFCNRRRLDIDARLRLFCSACAAVQYAHQHLVVHRDLKPGNILVTAEGRVKLLDFGIAKLLERDDATDPRAHTLHALTPVYASPEQLQGAPATAASDVFSLGLILFELLTGRRAFALSSGSLAALRAVLETEPARASTVVTADEPAHAPGSGSQPASAVDHARARDTTPERLRRRLRGDLDTILDRALRRDPAERYASAQALLEDIRRHLDGMPIQALPPGRLYRTLKFLRRHRAGVAAAALVLLALTGGLGTAAWQAAIAARERDVARAETAKAQRVTEFLVNVFAAPNPFASGPERLDTFRVASLLQRGAARAQSELAQQPEVLIPLLHAIGRTFRLLPDIEAAEPLIETAVSLSRDFHGPDHPVFAAAITEQAYVRVARGRFADAEPLYREALRIRQQALGENHPDAIRSLSNLAAFLQRVGRTAEADSLLRIAAGRARATRTPDSVLLADILTRQGMLASARRDYDAALNTAREALAINRALAGPSHPRSIGDLNNIAVFLQRAGRHEEAEAVFREVLALQKQALGPEHPYVASLMATHAAALVRIGKHDGARQTFAAAVQLAPRLPPRTAAFIALRFGSFLESQGDHGEAEQRYREAIATLKMALSNQDPDIGVYQLSLAALLCTTGRREAGAAVYEEALGTLSRLLPPDHREVTRAKTGWDDCRSPAATRPDTAQPYDSPRVPPWLALPAVWFP